MDHDYRRQDHLQQRGRIKARSEQKPGLKMKMNSAFMLAVFLLYIPPVLRPGAGVGRSMWRKGSIANRCLLAGTLDNMDDMTEDVAYSKIVSSDSGS